MQQVLPVSLVLPVLFGPVGPSGQAFVPAQFPWLNFAKALDLLKRSEYFSGIHPIRVIISFKFWPDCGELAEWLLHRS